MEKRPEDIDPTASARNDTEGESKVRLLGIGRYNGYNLYRFSDGSEIKVKMPERKKKRW